MPRVSRAPIVEDRVVFESAVLRIGSFRARPEDVDFADAGKPRWPVFVFPRTGVWIEHAGGRPFVADPSVVTLYNRCQRYRRRRLSPEGDRCDYFALEPSLVREIVTRYAPAAEVVRRERPFRSARVRSDGPTYLSQRSLVRALHGGAPVAPRRVEATALELLDRLIAASYRDAEPQGGRRLGTRHRALAEAARARLSIDLAEPLPLARLARDLAVSPEHLCRVFRRAAGRTVHAYRNELRLRAALGPTLRSGSELSRIAHDHGYASHSHFSTTFRRCFGVTPSTARARSIS